MEDVAPKHLKLEDGVLESLLAEEGWTVRQSTPGVWAGKLPTAARDFSLVIRHDREANYLYFALVPFLASPESEKRAAELYDRMLQLNQVVFMAKFAIDDELDVMLSVEYPTLELDPSEVKDAVRALAHYAQLHWDELSGLADPAHPPAIPVGDNERPSRPSSPEDWDAPQASEA